MKSKLVEQLSCEFCKLRIEAVKNPHSVYAAAKATGFRLALEMTQNYYGTGQEAGWIVDYTNILDWGGDSANAS